MAKEAFYFSHDYNSRNDPKMVVLMMKVGMVGIGVYWCIVEMLYEQSGYIMHSECERIAFELRIDATLIQSVIESDLFVKDDKKFWSESVLKRLKKRQDKSAKARESAFYRWPDANAERSFTDSNAIKERKGNKRKGDFSNNPLPRGVKFDKSNSHVVFPDGSTQKLGENQKSLLEMEKLKPKDVVKTLIN